MAQPFPDWVLDPARNQYYYFSVEEQAYIYRSGEKIFLSSAADAGTAATPYVIPPSVFSP
jgi:hypothetical protein